VGAQSVNLPGSCWTASGDLVVFSSDVDGVDRVYVAPAAGGAARVVTPRRLVAFEPSFAPGGRRIAFQRSVAGRSEIWKVRVDGTGLRRLTVGHDDREPNWSPSGDRIVFQRHTRGQADLWTIDPGGGHARNLTRTPGLEETDASWSPDGRFLVFSSDGDGVDIASLFTIRASGGRRRRLTRTHGIYDGAPSWSPDGRWIAFESTSSDPDRSRGATIWLIRAGTSASSTASKVGVCADYAGSVARLRGRCPLPPPAKARSSSWSTIARVSVRDPRPAPLGFGARAVRAWPAARLRASGFPFSASAVSSLTAASPVSWSSGARSRALAIATSASSS
jgi:TolB protein